MQQYRWSRFKPQSAAADSGSESDSGTLPRLGHGPLVTAVKQARISESDSDCQPECRRGPVNGQLIFRVRDSESSLA